MAYGFQYIPSERRRSARRPVGPGRAAQTGPPQAPSVFTVAPTARAIADVIEAIYSDIEDLRLSVSDGHPHPRGAG